MLCLVLLEINYGNGYNKTILILRSEIMSKGKEKKKQISCCDTCSNYVYDDEYEYYSCEMNLDEDEMGKFMTDTFYNCPYYQYDDEYAIVRKQN